MPTGVYKRIGRGATWKHGLTHDRFHRIWRAVYLRCKDKENLIYGGRGIKCEWKSFEEFKNDMHESYLLHIKQFGEKDTTIDRINNNWDYFKENCRWATYREQANNRRSSRFLSFNGKNQTISDWSKELDINRGAITKRLLLGWSIEKTLTTKLK